MTVPEPLRLKRYATLLVRWLLVASVVFILTIFSGVYITENVLHKVYTAIAQVQLRPRGYRGVSGTSPTFDPIDFQAQFEIMRSSAFLMPIITDLQLDKIWAKRRNSGLDVLTAEDALEHLNKVLKLGVVRGSNVINITVSSAAPQEAADIANAIAFRYKVLRDVQEVQLQRGAVHIISAEIPTAPSWPNKRVDFLLTLAVAALASVTLASFVEIVLLFLRAAEAA